MFTALVVDVRDAADRLTCLLGLARNQAGLLARAENPDL